MLDWLFAKKNIKGAKKAQAKGKTAKARKLAEKGYIRAAKASIKKNQRRGWW